ncbi:hypothetical protein [Piscibacillus salipiscarius]|uniref:hypothetical protein n=1 Tax=Piscibacillus salipiscarius TaxID=299480 RepID=UPI002436688D|nr:hypothetical protein [Piscibacillus salipiscarius]
MNYVVTTTLPPTFGGRTKALLKRTKLLVEKKIINLHWLPQIITMTMKTYINII